MRIGGSLLNDIYFEIPIGNQGGVRIQIANLSTTGLLLMGGQFDIPEEVVGTIGYKDNNMKVKIKVVRKDMYMFGVKAMVWKNLQLLWTQFSEWSLLRLGHIVPADKLKESNVKSQPGLFPVKGDCFFYC